MREKCSICGKELDNLNFTLHAGGHICEECYLNNSTISNSSIDLNELNYVYNHMNLYNESRLKEIAYSFKILKHNVEANEIERYIASSKNLIRGSRSKVWSTFLRVISYIFWVLITLICCVAGYRLGNISNTVEGGFVGAITGAIIGGFIGFALIAQEMLFITMCDNISTSTDNIAEVLKLLNDSISK